MPARFVYLSVSAKPNFPTRYKEAPVQAQSLAILPVFCGISGSIKATLSECSIYINFLNFKIIAHKHQIRRLADGDWADLITQADWFCGIYCAAAKRGFKIDSEWKQIFKFIKKRSGLGFMQGLSVDESVKTGDIIKEAQKNALIIISCGTNDLRFLPPLIITQKHIDEMQEKLRQSLKKFA